MGFGTFDNPGVIIEQAQNDEIFPEVMKASIDFDESLMIANLDALNMYTKLIPFFTEGYNLADPWDLLSIYICYNWETFYTARRSMIIGLNANYNNAFALLRGVYDLQIQGAFFQCVSQEYLRDRGVPKDAKPGVKEAFYKITQYLDSESEERARSKKLPVYIFDILRQISGEDSKPEIYSMLKAFEFWLRSDTFSTYLPSTDDLYFRLSRNVHENFLLTDIGRQLESGANYAFQRPPIPIEKYSIEYFETFNELMDFCLAIQIGVFRLNLNYTYFCRKVQILKETEASSIVKLKVAKTLLDEF